MLQTSVCSSPMFLLQSHRSGQGAGCGICHPLFLLESLHPTTQAWLHPSASWFQVTASMPSLSLLPSCFLQSLPQCLPPGLRSKLHQCPSPGSPHTSSSSTVPFFFCLGPLGIMHIYLMCPSPTEYPLQVLTVRQQLFPALEGFMWGVCLWEVKGPRDSVLYLCI